MRRIVPLLVVVSLWSCSPMGPGEDGGMQPTDSGVVVDSGVQADAGVEDAGIPDAGTEVDAGSPDAGDVDAGSPDAGPMGQRAGYGMISGDCGPLSLVDLNSPSPSTYENRIDFAMGTFDAGLLSDGGYRMFNTPNAGGSSGNSEVFAFEVLHRCEYAELAATETEVTYTPPTSKKTDIVVSIEGQVVGVSVARAFKFPPGTPLPVSDARNLLNGKFSDIQVSTMNVNPPWQWNKQILHVLAYDDVAKQAVIDAAAQIDAGVRGDTILFITTTDGNDAFIY
ncbi:MAG: hypothetical protein ACO1OB_20920 [Archangium sp.]